MKIIDIHSHLQFSDFDELREEIIAEMANRDQGTIVVGTNLETSEAAIDLANSHDNVWATVGQHPTVVDDFDAKAYVNLMTSARSGKVVAVGECGFDFFRSDRSDEYARQLEVFQKQIDIAARFQLPLVLHGRPTAGTMNAYQDMLELLKDRRDDLAAHPGNAHFFVGDLEIARKFLEMNFTVSFDGPITFARDYDEVIRYIPSDMIHAETDAPYAAPVPYRGQQNSPLYVNHVIDSLIEIRNEAHPNEFRRQLVQNSQRVFNLL